MNRSAGSANTNLAQKRPIFPAFLKVSIDKTFFGLCPIEPFSRIDLTNHSVVFYFSCMRVYCFNIKGGNRDAEK